MTARTLMVQGTASSVGKSIVVTALCRFFARQGLRVAPFKSQNMALNAFVTREGKEIGRAQAVQAEAARVVPTVHMNPILLKPEGDSRSQVVLLGEPIGSLSAIDYHARKPALRRAVGDSLSALRADYDLVVIEGAGSPAEINLREHELVNMFVARIADAPVLLVGDIDRGGVFASLVGTMELLEPHDRERVRGFIINKFRGDLRLLHSGLEFLEQRTGIPVLGVLPHLRDLRVADEDSASLELRRTSRRARADELDIAVISFPRMSNFDDFLPLEKSPNVLVRYIESPHQIRDADLLILPGTKTTTGDLAWLRDAGFDAVVRERAASGGLVLGVCGGCQMLGGAIRDPEQVESGLVLDSGLGILALDTAFGRTKRTTQVSAVAASHSWLAAEGASISGYEIHMGRTAQGMGAKGAFHLSLRNGVSTHEVDGAVSERGNVIGTMIHGLFDNANVTETLIAQLRERRGWGPLAHDAAPPVVDEYDRLADAIGEHLDVDQLRKIVFGRSENAQ